MTASLPVRGDTVADLDIPLPPGKMPLWRKGRLLKRWRYVGVYGPEVMVCAGRVRVGPIPQAFWGVVEAGRPVRDRTALFGRDVEFDGSRVRVSSGDISFDVLVEEGGGVESVNAHGGDAGYVWTRKQAGVPARGSVRVGDRSYEIDGLAVVDETAGYHARHTHWTWSAGVGRSVDGRRVGWNLVTDINDGPTESERTLWVDGEPTEVAPVEIASDLSRVTGPRVDLAFTEWPGSARVDNTNALLMKSEYRQPFGTFSGSLPNGIELAEAYGVMETHKAVW
jgi:hypothetical protein